VKCSVGVGEVLGPDAGQGEGGGHGGNLFPQGLDLSLLLALRGLNVVHELLQLAPPAEALAFCAIWMPLCTASATCREEAQGRRVRGEPDASQSEASQVV